MGWVDPIVFFGLVVLVSGFQNNAKFQNDLLLDMNQDGPNLFGVNMITAPHGAPIVCEIQIIPMAIAITFAFVICLSRDLWRSICNQELVIRDLRSYEGNAMRPCNDDLIAHTVGGGAEHVIILAIMAAAREFFF